MASSGQFGAGGPGKGAGRNSIPEEAKVMKQILAELDITDYEPQVIAQMLDFSYEYLTEILEDAKGPRWTRHAGRFGGCKE